MHTNSTPIDQTVKPRFVLPVQPIIQDQNTITVEATKVKSTTPTVVNLNPVDELASKTPSETASDSADASDAVQPFVLDAEQPLDPRSFPNQPRNSSHQLPATIANVQHLLWEYGIVAKYNIIKKKLKITVPGHSGSPDNFDNVVLTQIMSLAALNGLPLGQIPSLVDAVGDRNQYNPVAVWITSKPWDKVDRRQDMYDTLMEREDFPKNLKEKLMYRWLLSAVAAALMPSGFRCRGALTLQGPQGIGKTAWVSALVPNEMLRAEVIKLDHHLDASNKDSLLSAICHWICEIGELDGSLKKDIARLKGFITDGFDKVRRPYGRLDSEYPRRTVFCATVNDSNFLVDPTGNTRWWTIPVTKIIYQHDIDMQQVFAQFAVDLWNGEQWWLTTDEEQNLELHNKDHRTVSALNERILDAVDLEKAQNTNLPAMTPTEVLRAIGIERATNLQCKECGAILRELFGESKRIHGRDKWRVPLKHLTRSPAPIAIENDLY